MNKEYKGKINIVVRDASTGEIKQEITTENMITDAVVNLLNSGLARRHQMLYNSMPLIQALMGGIMLFDAQIDETKLVPTAVDAAHMIGNANSTGEITDSNYKGILSSATVNKDGAEFVFTFGASKGVGTIRAICLTSDLGGELGCKIMRRDASRTSNSFTDTLFNLNPSDDEDIDILTNSLGGDVIDDVLGSRSTIYSNSGVWVLSSNNVNKFDVRSNTALYKYTANIKDGYNLDIQFTGYDAEKDFLIHKEDIEQLVEFLDVIGGPISGKAYAVSFEYQMNKQDWTEHVIMHLASYSGGNGHLSNVDVTDLANDIVSDYASHGSSDYYSLQTIAAVLSASVSAMRAYNDKIYWFVGNMQVPQGSDDFFKLYIIETSGAYSSINVSSSSPFDVLSRECVTSGYLLKGVLNSNDTSDECVADQFDIAVINDELYLYIGGYYFHIDIDNSRIISTPYLYLKNGKQILKRLTTDSFSKTPFYRVLGDSGVSYDFSSTAFNFSLPYSFTSNILRMNYLATIANLATPVVKGSGDTLTITYTLSKQDTIS